MGLEDLIVRLRIEEDNRVFEKKVRMLFMTCNTNVVEQVLKTNKKRKQNNNDFRGDSNKRFKGNCYICNKQGYWAKDCYHWNSQRNQGNKRKNLPKPIRLNIL